MNFANRLNYIKAAISFILGLSVATTSFSQRKSIVRMGQRTPIHLTKAGYLTVMGYSRMAPVYKNPETWKIFHSMILVGKN
jgi:hypothetical protein